MIFIKVDHEVILNRALPQAIQDTQDYVDYLKDLKSKINSFCHALMEEKHDKEEVVYRKNKHYITPYSLPYHFKLGTSGRDSFLSN